MVQKMNICKNIFGDQKHQQQTLLWSKHPDWLWIPTSTTGSSTGLKQPRCEADHWPPSNVQVKNEWSYTSATPTCLHSMNRCCCCCFVMIIFITIGLNWTAVLVQTWWFLYYMHWLCEGLGVSIDSKLYCHYQARYVFFQSVKAPRSHSYYNILHLNSQ